MVKILILYIKYQGLNWAKLRRYKLMLDLFDIELHFKMSYFHVEYQAKRV